MICGGEICLYSSLSLSLSRPCLVMKYSQNRPAKQYTVCPRLKSIILTGWPGWDSAVNGLRGNWTPFTPFMV